MPTTKDPLKRKQYWDAWYAKNKERTRARVARNNAEYRAVAREWIWDYLLTHPCTDCGETDPVVLEFDHVRGEKVRDVANMVVRAMSLTVIQQEVEKCDVRCANCHRRITALRGGSWRVSR